LSETQSRAVVAIEAIGGKKIFWFGGAQLKELCLEFSK
jgi:hypothetical protein